MSKGRHIHKRREAPPTPGERCTCPGCWACKGHEVGCTCDIDWDELHERRRDES